MDDVYTARWGGFGGGGGGCKGGGGGGGYIGGRGGLNGSENGEGGWSYIDRQGSRWTYNILLSVARDIRPAAGRPFYKNPVSGRILDMTIRTYTAWHRI